ncbi:carboxypeptidase-like regulatory domain-containing protein [Cellulomonas sp. PhB150]|uniref:carboxypeptidase-like regulatory domain-containing protein n=1 Tax=Cellulomonas sp. PhB150 TaxID=2485188 RepID=UPI000F4A976D|nr:carboxypeptidase-like regulatory domain-containing protein [Cellulomonas sp. PhB150]ROS21777.1 carboxypeptidase family protein [Cellulomonas sp. PhB150]
MAVAPQGGARAATSVLVEPGAHATPGSSATLRVHARNVTRVPQDLIVSLVGLESGWQPAPVPVPGVAPDATITLELPLTPPVGSTPGDYPFVVVVEAGPTGSPATRATTLADASLRIDGLSELVVTVEPADSRAVRSRRVQVVLANTGDQAARVRLDAQADQGSGARIDLDAQAVEIQPHTSVRVGARAGMRGPRLVGQPRRAGYHVTATGARAPQRFDASFTARPLFTGGLLRGLAIATVAILWVGAVIAALPWLTDQFSGSGQSVDKQAGVSATTAPGAPDDGTGNGGNGGAGDGGDGGTDGSGDGGDGSDGTEGVRVAGVITSADPEGVTVQVVPAAVLEAAAASGDASGDTNASGETGDLLARGGAVVEQAAAAGPGVVRLAAHALRAAKQADDAAPAGKVSSLALPVERTDETSQRLTTTTGTDGAWAFAGLSPTGRYLIVLAKPGYQTQRYWVTGAQAAAAPLELALAPGEGQMSGTVTGPNGAVGGVEITLSDGTTTVTTRTATSGQVGRWSVEGLSTPTTYLVTAVSDRLGAQSELVRLDAAGSRTVNLRLKAGVSTLSGTVVGRDSLGGQGGLGGVTVTAKAGEVSRTATTVTGDNAGTFVLPDLPVPGTYTVSVKATGYATQTHRIRLTAAGRAPLSLSLTSQGGTVEGTTLDDSGAGVAAAGLTLSGSGGTFKTMSASDAQGTFRFDGIPAGQYVLAGESFGHQPASAQVTVKATGSASAKLVLARLDGDGLVATAHIRGRATDASTGARLTCPNLLPGEKCQLTVTTTVQLPGENPKTITVKSDPDTPYELPRAGDGGLYPGLYHLTLRAPGYEPGTVDVTVPMGQVVEAATVALYPSPSIVGSVAARIGVVPSSTCVVAVPRDGTAPGDNPCGPDTTGKGCASSAGACSFIGVNGSYEIDRLSSGAYDVYVVPVKGSEYVAPEKVSVTLTPGDVRRVDSTLDRRGVLTIAVYASDGTGALFPADDAEVTLTAPDVTDRTGTTEDGIVQFRNLPAASYLVTATTKGGGPEGTLKDVAVGLNQELQSQVVLTATATDVAGRVVTLLGGTAATPVDKATVTVSGVTGYRGVSPIRQTGTPAAVTTSTGDFTVCTATSGCPTTPSTTALALIETRMDIRVTADGFADYSANGVDTTTLAPITLTPLGRTFTGAVTLEQAVDAATENPKVQFDIQKAPPGVGQMSLVATADGKLVWSDSAQPLDPSAPANDDRRFIRPGTYTVVASLPGYTSSMRTFTVPTGTTTVVPSVAFSLSRYGSLRIKSIASPLGTDVLNTVVTVTSNGTSVRREALPGDAFVDFGDMAPGSYQVQVRAAGFQTFDSTVTLKAGQPVTDPSVVTLNRLGSITGLVKAQITPTFSQGVPGAAVTVTNADGDSFSTVTDASGSYTVTGDLTKQGLTNGTWTVTATATGYGTAGSSTTVLVTAPATATATTITLTPNKGELRVFAVAGADPVDGLTMSLTYSDEIRLEPTCTASSPKTDTCTPTPGVYVFSNLGPLTYNLNISGLSYSPLTLPVEMAAGQTRTITVPITAPNGSVQGLVMKQAASGVTTPVKQVTVTLDPDADGVDSRTVDTDDDGRYRFATVPAGAYTLKVSDDGLSATRAVVLQPGDGLVVDLTLTEQTHPLTVTVTSSSDLTGALVSLSGPSSPAAQPVVRTDDDTFSTTFSQLPAGEWTVKLSGPAGHLGVWQTTATVPDDDAVSITAQETQVRLRATTTVATTPDTLSTTVTPVGGTARTMLVSVGGSDTVVWVPRSGGANVTATVTGGWTLAISPAGTPTVPANVDHQTVTLALSAKATTVAITSATPAALVQGDTLTVQTKVTSGGANVGDGSVTLERSSGGTWSTVGSAKDLSGTGTATLTADSEDWAAGTQQLRVVYSGSGAFAAGTVAVTGISVTIPTATTTTITASATKLDAVVASSGSGTPPGAVKFERQNGGGSWVTITGCASVNLSAGAASCTATLTAAWVVRATYVPSSTSWLASTSGTATVPAPPAPDPDPAEPVTP